MTASKYSYLGGFVATSNVYAGFLSGVPVSGTQAHSFIMSFESEEDIAKSRIIDGKDLLPMAMKYREELGWTSTKLPELYAFISFASAYPDGFSALIDSYSTLGSGVKNFLCVALALGELGHQAKGVRLDSGDLAQLSKECRKLFIEIGAKYDRDFSKLSIVASNDINENSLIALNEVGHEMDVFGIGTNLVTCQAQPALGMVYKVVEFKGTPRIKFSEELEKVTLPGPKSVLRVFKGGKPVFDILCTRGEVADLVGNPSNLKVINSREFDT
jgi:nicotinate phosphoribosyltransferase